MSGFFTKEGLEGIRLANELNMDEFYDPYMGNYIISKNTWNNLSNKNEIAAKLKAAGYKMAIIPHCNMDGELEDGVFDVCFYDYEDEI